MKAAQQDPNPERVIPGDPNAPAHVPQRRAGEVEAFARGFAKQFADTIPGTGKLIGQGLNLVGGLVNRPELGSGLVKPSEAWLKANDDFYAGSLERRDGIAPLHNDMRFKEGQQIGAMVDLGLALAGIAKIPNAPPVGNAAVRAGAATQQAAARSANAAGRSADAVADFATTARKAQGTLPPGFQFDGPPVAMRAPDLVPPKAAPSMPKANPTAGSASIAADIASNPPTAPRGTPKLGQNTVTRAALVDDVKKMGVDAPDSRPKLPELWPTDQKDGSQALVRYVGKRRVAEFVESTNVPANVKDEVAAAVQKEATRRAGNSSPEKAIQRIDNYITELKEQPNTAALFNERADRLVRRKGVEQQVSNLVVDQGFQNRDRNRIANYLRPQLEGLSQKDAAKFLANVSRTPEDVAALAQRAGAQAPVRPNPLDQINLLNDRSSAVTPGKLRPDMNLPAEAIGKPGNIVTQTIHNLAELGRAQTAGIRKARDYVVDSGLDALRSMTPGRVQNAMDGVARLGEGAADFIGELGNEVVIRNLHRAADALPEPVTDAATKVVTAAAKTGELVYKAWDSDISRATQTVVGDGAGLFVLSQLHTLEPYSGVIGEDPDLDQLGRMTFLPKGAFVAGLRSGEDTIGEFYAGTAFHLGWDFRPKAPGRLAFKPIGGTEKIGTGLARFMQLQNYAILGMDKDSIDFARLSFQQFNSYGGGAWNPPGYIGSTRLPNGQDGYGIQVGTQGSITGSGPGTTTAFGLTLGPVMIAQRDAVSPSLFAVMSQTGVKTGLPIDVGAFALPANTSYTSPALVNQLRDFRGSMPSWLQGIHDFLAGAVLPNYSDLKEILDNPPADGAEEAGEKQP